MGKDHNQASETSKPRAHGEASGITYFPLDEDQDEIRLITILPFTEESPLVQCTLETVSLKSFAPEYEVFLAGLSQIRPKRKTALEWRNRHSDTKTSSSEVMDKHIPAESAYRFTWGDYAALSYVWGDPRNSRAIVLNGQVIQVGRNLEVALRALGQRPDFHDGYKLWVDAICINQDDYQERGRQIVKMRSIYGDAWAVIAWLGEEKDDGDKAIALVQALSDASTNGHTDDLEAKLRNDPSYLGAGHWTALEVFMSREYWYRLWIIQEVVLGASSLVLRCGNSFIDWNSFCLGIGLLFAHLWTAKDYILDYEAWAEDGIDGAARGWTTTSLHLVYRDLWALNQFEEQSGKHNLSLGRLLDIANSAEARDLRDKVYGLEGLMDPIITENLSPDYKLTPSKVYTSVAKAFIETYSNLEPIREGNPWGKNHTPSWAADWDWDGRLRHRRPAARLWGPFWTSQGPPQDSQAAIPYRASGDIPMKASFSEDILQLTCNGFIFDEISGLSARESGYFAWPEPSIVQSDKDTNAYGSTSGTATALYHALVTDRVADGQRANERHAATLSLPSNEGQAMHKFNLLGWTWLSLLRFYYFRWSRWRQANRNFQLMGKPLEEYFSQTIPDGASEYDYKEVYSCFDRTCKGRRCMTTAKGYLGWAPDNIHGTNEDQVRKGDKLAIIPGCSVPIVIRPHGDFFQVLGEAYVQGIMDGEALELLKSKECEARDFVFC